MALPTYDPIARRGGSWMIYGPNGDRLPVSGTMGEMTADAAAKHGYRVEPIQLADAGDVDRAWEMRQAGSPGLNDAVVGLSPEDRQAYQNRLIAEQSLSIVPSGGPGTFPAGNMPAAMAPTGTAMPSGGPGTFPAGPMPAPVSGREASLRADLAARGYAPDVIDRLVERTLNADGTGPTEEALQRAMEVQARSTPGAATSMPDLPPLDLGEADEPWPGLSPWEAGAGEWSNWRDDNDPAAAEPVTADAEAARLRALGQSSSAPAQFPAGGSYTPYNVGTTPTREPTLRLAGQPAAQFPAGGTYFPETGNVDDPIAAQIAETPVTERREPGDFNLWDTVRRGGSALSDAYHDITAQRDQEWRTLGDRAALAVGGPDAVARRQAGREPIVPDTGETWMETIGGGLADVGQHLEGIGDMPLVNPAIGGAALSALGAAPAPPAVEDALPATGGAMPDDMTSFRMSSEDATAFMDRMFGNPASPAPPAASAPAAGPMISPPATPTTPPSGPTPYIPSNEDIDGPTDPMGPMPPMPTVGAPAGGVGGGAATATPVVDVDPETGEVIERPAGGQPGAQGAFDPMAVYQDLLGSIPEPADTGITWDDAGDLMMTAGVGMMQAGSRPGATTLGAIGEGAGDALGRSRDIEASRAEQAQKAQDRAIDLAGKVADYSVEGERLRQSGASDEERARHNRHSEAIAEARLRLSEAASARAAAGGGRNELGLTVAQQQAYDQEFRLFLNSAQANAIEASIYNEGGYDPNAALQQAIEMNPYSTVARRYATQTLGAVLAEAERAMANGEMGEEDRAALEADLGYLLGTFPYLNDFMPDL